MKTSIIFSEGIKQIVMTPESDSEKSALGMITINDDIEVSSHSGDVYSGNKSQTFRAQFSMCRGGHLRLFEDSESLILVLKPKKVFDIKVAENDISVLLKAEKVLSEHGEDGTELMADLRQVITKLQNIDALNNE